MTEASKKVVGNAVEIIDRVEKFADMMEKAGFIENGTGPISDIGELARDIIEAVVCESSPKASVCDLKMKFKYNLIDDTLENSASTDDAVKKFEKLCG